MSLPAKATVAWFLLFVVMFANGALRVLVLQPRLGEDTARQAASLSGAVLVLLVSSGLVRAAPSATPAQLLKVGAAWLAATVAFEFLFGHFVSGLSWRALLADYDVFRGRLWSLILICVALGPWLCGTLRTRR
jgi:heme/copper-type cytochrome/quinol oxidase subunit 3